jgi:hypothetical protein
MSMMIDHTYFEATTWQMYNPNTGQQTEAMGDHHYAGDQVGSQAQIHLARGYNGYPYSSERIQNTFAHEAWHSFTTSDTESQRVADKCVPTSGTTPPPPQT